MDQLDARMLLMGRGPQMADPLELQQKRMTLANLARADELGAMKLDEYKRDQSRQAAFESELPALVQSNFATDAVVSSVARNPTAAQAILAEQGKRLKEQYANAKTAAETQEINGKARKAELEIVGGLAGYLADKQDLSPDDIKAAAANLQRMGLDPRALMPGSDALDPAAWKAHYAQLAQTAVGAAKQLEFKGQAAARAETARHNQSTEGLTARGQNMVDARAQQRLAVDRGAAEAAMVGAPQEIMVNGVPTLAIYDKRTGTFYDANKRTPIQEGMGPKGGDLPASVREKMAQNNVTLTKIDNALQLVKEQPQAFGLKNMLGDTVRQRTDSEGVDARAAVADIAGQKIHDRSGAAVTIGEMKRLTAYIPNVNDAPDVVEKKLKQFRKEYAQVQEELAAGRSVAELMARRPKDGETKPITTLQAPKIGETRKGYVYKGGDPAQQSSWEKV